MGFGVCGSGCLRFTVHDAFLSVPFASMAANCNQNHALSRSLAPTLASSDDSSQLLRDGQGTAHPITRSSQVVSMRLDEPIMNSS